MRLTTLLLVTIALLSPSPLWAQQGLPSQKWTVDGDAREGLVYAPKSAKSEATRVLFVFHGHGGTARHAARTMAFHTAWPEAICVYLQGLPTPGVITDPEGKKNGWQKTPGDQKDRDLKFFDEALAWLKKEYKVDEKRIYSTGHSNGGAFTYLLAAQRGEVLAAIAPSASAAGRRLGEIKPLPVMHIAGRNDPLVNFTWQEATINAIKKTNGASEGKPWGEHCIYYASEKGAPLVTYITDGTHTFEQGAVKEIVRFFKEQVRK
jgi:polyhydroxybutyrate depolymerase